MNRVHKLPPCIKGLTTHDLYSPPSSEVERGVSNLEAKIHRMAMLMKTQPWYNEHYDAALSEILSDFRALREAVIQEKVDINP